MILAIFEAACHRRQRGEYCQRKPDNFLSYKNKRLLARIKGVIKMGKGNLTCNWVGIRKEERENKQTNPGIDEIMKNGSSEKGHSSS